MNYFLKVTDILAYDRHIGLRINNLTAPDYGQP